jgi:transcriptional regulator with XRE-family HTH domain
MDDKQLLKHLKNKRAVLGMSATELARRSNVSPLTIRNYEIGSSDPLLSNVINIAEQLGYEIMLRWKGLPQERERDNGI